MTEENDNLPEIGDIDWQQLEHMANEGAEEDAPEVLSSTTILTDSMVNKRLVWDVSPHQEVERIAAYLGLPAASEEGLDMEHVEAHVRTESVILLATHLNLLSTAAARAVFANMVVMGDHEEETPLDGDEFKEQTAAMEIVIFNAALGIVSELVDWGLLHTPYVITTEEFEELKRMNEEAQEEDGSE